MLCVVVFIEKVSRDGSQLVNARHIGNSESMDTLAQASIPA
jgi:hypothetical protein